jgi:hypothetical protein
MANKDNLMSVQELNASKTPEERIESARKAGIASGKAKREAKIFKKAIAERMGFDDFNEMIDNLIERAKGNDKSFEILRDTIGQKPIEKQENIVSMNNPFSELTVEELKKLAGENDN